MYKFASAVFFEIWGFIVNPLHSGSSENACGIQPTIHGEWESPLECKGLQNDYLFMIQSTARRYPLLISIFLAIVGYHLEKRCVFWGDPRIDPFFDFFIRAEMLINQASCHRSKQRLVGRSIVWRVRRVWQDLSFQRFQVCLDGLWDMWPSIFMLEDNFVVYLLVPWPFLLQCSAQTHQLRSIPTPCDGFTRL